MTDKDGEVQSVMSEKCYDEAVEKTSTYATSFAEYDLQEAASEAVEEIAELTTLFNQMVENIMFSYDVEDRAFAIQSLADEYKERVTQLMDEGGIKAISFDDSEWSGAASNWDTAEEYCKDCLIDLNPSGAEKTKAMCKLPYRKPGSSTPNKAALRTMATGRGISAITRPAGVSQALFDAKKKQAANKLIGWWKLAFDEIAPESIFEAAGKERPAEKAVEPTEEQRRGWFEQIKSFFLGTKCLDVHQNGIRLTKDAAGKSWILLWSTNAFIDREKEIFTTKSIDDFIERHEEDDIKGEVWFCHFPGSKFADIKMQARVGRFLLEAAPFDDTEMGEAFEKFFQEYPESHSTLAPNGWGQSHGYKFRRKDRVNGIYTAFEKHESTILPWDIAANQHNPRPRFTREGILMNEKQQEAFESVFGKSLVAEMVSQGETKTAELEATGVAYKAVEEEVVEEAVEEVVEEVKEEAVEEAVEEVEEKAAEETVEEEVKEEVAEEVVPEEKEVEAPITREEITQGLKVFAEEMAAQFEKMVEEKVSAAVDELIEVVVPLAKQVKELSASEETKIARSVSETPASSLAAMVRGSIIGSKDTLVDGRTSLAKDGPAEEAKKEVNGPKVAGVSLNLWN
jgi:hypothetical protein